MFNRWIEAALLDTLREEALGCIVFSPLAQGMLSNKYLKGIPSDSRAAKPHGFLKPDNISEHRLSQIARLNELAAQRSQTLPQMALAWVLRHPEVTSALIGASKVSQIEEALGVLNRLNFEEGELEAIERILAE